MYTAYELPLSFATDRAGRGPLTWGQLSIWDVLRWLPPGDTSLNMSDHCDVAESLSLDGVLAAVRKLTERHDSLHTLYCDTADGPYQEVVGSGTTMVTVYELEDSAVSADSADGLGELLRTTPFDNSKDLPARFAVLTRSGRAVKVLVAVSHMAVDAWSFRIVVDELTALLSAPDAVLPPAGQQPLARAAFEASGEGRELEARSMTHWAELMENVPAPMLHSVRGAEAPSFEWTHIESPAMAMALSRLSDGLRIDPAAVMMGATSLLLAAYTGRPRAALRLIVSTRFETESSELVGAFNQNALCCIDVTDEPLPEYLNRMARIVLDSYGYCEYDPRKLEAMVAQVAIGRGLTPDGYCFFNNVSSLFDGDAAEERLDADALRRRLVELRSETTVASFDHDNTPKGANFFLSLERTSGRVAISLAVQHGFFAPRNGADFLLDCERLLLRAATGEVSAISLFESFAQAGTGKRPA